MALALATSGFSQTTKPARPRDALVEHDINELHGLSTIGSSGRYRVTPGDVLQLTFPYVPEFDQVVTVQPDGYIALRGVDDVHVSGRTVPEIKVALVEAYEPALREPAITIVLKEFDKPYFIAAGEVTRPGKHDLRSATTVSQGLAVAGGPTGSARHADVVVFRRHGDELVAVTKVNIKRMYDARNLSEDPLLRTGDTLFVPKSSWSAISPFLPRPGILLSPFVR